MNPFDSTEILISANQKMGAHYLTIFSNIGNLILPIMFEEPELLFFCNFNKKHKEIFGPLDLGFIGHGNSISLKLIIKNPTSYNVLLSSIDCSSYITVIYDENTYIDTFSTYEVKVFRTPMQSLLEPIHFRTSIGTYSIAIALTVVFGNIKLKPIYITELFPKVHREEFIYLVNNYSVPVKIHSISSSLEILSFEKIKEVVLPDKEQVIGKLIVSVPFYEKIQLNFKKSLTYGDARL